MTINRIPDPKFKYSKYNFLICAFVLFISIFGCIQVFCEQGTVLVVNGDMIYRDDFDHALAKYEDSYRRYFGENIDPVVYDRMKKELIDDLITKQLYIQEAKRRGISARVFAGEEEIEELLIKNPVFYTDGRFDEAKYERFSIEASSDAKSIRDRAESVILSDKIREILPSKVIASLKEDVTISDKEVLDEYLNRAEKMRVKYVAVDVPSLANNIGVTEDEIRSYYDRNRGKYEVPALKKYAVLYFDPQDYASSVIVTDGMINDYYNEHPDQYRTEKMTKIKYVLFRTKDYIGRIYSPGVNTQKYYEANIDRFVEPAEAKVSFISMKKPCPDEKLRNFISDLKLNLPFPEMAAKYSDDNATSQNGGDLGYIKKGTLKEPFDGIAFSLKAGETSGIIETEKGYYVIAVQDKKDERLKSFDEVKGDIEGILLNDEASPLALADAKRFRVDAKKSGFEETVGKKNLTTYDTDYFRASDKVPMIGKNNLFTYTALNLPTGEVSNVIDYNGGYAVFIVEDVRSQESMPLEAVREDIEHRIVREDSGIIAEKTADHAVFLMNGGLPVSELPKRMDVRMSLYEDSATFESPADLGQVVSKGDGFYLTVLMTVEPSYVKDFSSVSIEAAADAAMDKADKAALLKTQEMVSSGSVTMEEAEETPPFSRYDYVIGKEYMKPFIEQCFFLREGKSGIIRSLNKYYVVQVLERGTKLSGYEDESVKIKTAVLREKRENYVRDWLKKERERAEIQINI